MEKIALIVAGGVGNRLKKKIPKQFLTINQAPVLIHTIKRFAHLDRIIVVIPKNYFDLWEGLCQEYKFKIKHELVEGGGNRFFSVKNGLGSINTNGIIIIHDGVRPFVSKELINQSISSVKKNTGIVPTMPVTNSIRSINQKRSKNLTRKTLHSIQTPQSFRIKDIKQAYKQPFKDSFTDDSSVFEANGGKIENIAGEEWNIKITKPLDLDIANLLFKKLNLTK
jgi:2-C-methyl-D-erythritol 4-phosphate cytidylyltransferase